MYKNANCKNKKVVQARGRDYVSTLCNFMWSCMVFATATVTYKYFYYIYHFWPSEGTL